jgi:hypothetical protein
LHRLVQATEIHPEDANKQSVWLIARKAGDPPDKILTLHANNPITLV